VQSQGAYEPIGSVNTSSNHYNKVRLNSASDQNDSSKSQLSKSQPTVKIMKKINELRQKHQIESNISHQHFEQDYYGTMVPNQDTATSPLQARPREQGQDYYEQFT